MRESMVQIEFFGMSDFRILRQKAEIEKKRLMQAEITKMECVYEKLSNSKKKCHCGKCRQIYSKKSNKDHLTKFLFLEMNSINCLNKTFIDKH